MTASDSSILTLGYLSDKGSILPSEKAILCPRQTIFSFSAQAIAKLGDKVIKLRDRLVSLRVRSRKQAKLIKSLILNEQYCAKSLILNEQNSLFLGDF